MPDPASEINMIETFANTKMIGLTLNHQNITDDEVSAAITRYAEELKIPTNDALISSRERLDEMVLSAFHQIGARH